MKKAASREPGAADRSGDSAVVTVYVDGLAIRTASSFFELGSNRSPQVRFVLMTAGWEFDPERPIAVDHGMKVLSITRSARGAEIVVKFDEIERPVIYATITIKRQGECLHLVSKAVRFGVISSRVASPTKPKYQITVTEKYQKIHVSPMVLEVDANDRDVYITWQLESTNFKFTTNGIQITTPNNSELLPYFRDEKTFRMLNVNTSTREFKYDVNLIHNSGTLLLNCDPTIKNGTR